MNVRKAAACVLAGTTASLTIFVAPHAAADSTEAAPGKTTVTSPVAPSPTGTPSQTSQPGPTAGATASATSSAAATAGAATASTAGAAATGTMSTTAKPSPSVVQTSTVASTGVGVSPAAPGPSTTARAAAAGVPPLPTIPFPTEVVTVKLSLTIQTGSDEARTAVQGKPFRLQPTVVGGQAPYYWYSYLGENPEQAEPGSPAQPRMPEGLTLNNLTGEISGTPTRPGVYAFDLVAGEMRDDESDPNTRMGGTIVVMQVLPATPAPTASASVTLAPIPAPPSSALASAKAVVGSKMAKGSAKSAKVVAAKAGAKHAGKPAAAAPEPTHHKQGHGLAATGADAGALGGLAAAAAAVAAGVGLLRRRKNG